jgi:hypothetical protein
VFGDKEADGPEDAPCRETGQRPAAYL